MKFRTIRKFYDWQDKRKEYNVGDIFESDSRIKIDRLVMQGCIDNSNLEANPLDLNELNKPPVPKKRGRPPKEIPLAECVKIERAML